MDFNLSAEIFEDVVSDIQKSMPNPLGREALVNEYYFALRILQLNTLYVD